MLLLNLDFTLPLKNPVIIFSLVLFIILFSPIIFHKIKVPHIIGLIIAGTLVGPYGLNLLLRDSSIVLFGTVGLLYIMFLAGLEIDLSEFKKNRNKILLFGLATFTLPLVTGALASYYILGYGFLSSVLLASMFSTHTLVAYPIASRYGVTRNRAVLLTIGGTMITDILALLILAAISGMTRESVSATFWVRLGGSAMIFVAIVFFGFPFIIRWFFKRFTDSVSQYIFVLAMVFLASFLAEAAGLEAIIGAFFAGLVLNKFVPHSSPLMNRIDFVGNALFIPFFLIGVGMLVDVSVLVKGTGALKVAGVVVFIAISAKYLAAKFTQKVLGMTKDEGDLIFGLSSSHAAATLAIILVGYNIIIGETPSGLPIRLLDEDVLNGTILLILVSCAISSFQVEKSARTIAKLEESAAAPVVDTGEKVLLSLAYPDTVAEMVDFGLMLRPRKSKVPVYALHVVSDEDENASGQSSGKKMMEKAQQHAAASENELLPLTRYDMSISSGIIYSIKEQNITKVLIGLHRSFSATNFFGPVVEKILESTPEEIFVYQPMQPLNTLTRIVAVLPPNAEQESGFTHWLDTVTILSKEAGLPLAFYAQDHTLQMMRTHNEQDTALNGVTYTEFANWDDFLIFSKEVKPNDLFLIVSSRRGHVSYTERMTKLPYYLTTYFTKNSFLLLFPKQPVAAALSDGLAQFTKPLETAASAAKPVQSVVGYVKGLFTK
ncbi:cation:proton antiporter [Hymenobacter aerilatus]|uniref:Cation:proton antiporter n=1 Tax=Hymenobacter aerilatus TaxID=2932251 RepID=A0A8T9SXJ6_9BACT|nr:cation:proton antiporter [Hymenobacter aerilatus]UOR06575.1 cation:proton antiporter [Hymenobacter aerilatus]